MKPGHLLHLTYSGFAGMTNRRSNGYVESEITTVKVYKLCAMVGMQEVKAAP